MNRLCFSLSILILLGAGCTSTSDVASVSVATSSETSSLPAPVASEIRSTFPDDATVIAPVVEVQEKPETLSVSMSSGNFFFDPTTILVQPGQEVSITFAENEGTHTFVIDEIGVNKKIVTGTVVRFIAPTTSGNYAYYCDVGAHRKLGMEGVLIVK